MEDRNLYVVRSRRTCAWGAICLSLVFACAAFEFQSSVLASDGAAKTSNEGTSKKRFNLFGLASRDKSESQTNSKSSAKSNEAKPARPALVNPYATSQTQAASKTQATSDKKEATPRVVQPRETQAQTSSPKVKETTLPSRTAQSSTAPGASQSVSSNAQKNAQKNGPKESFAAKLAPSNWIWGKRPDGLNADGIVEQTRPEVTRIRAERVESNQVDPEIRARERALENAARRENVQLAARREAARREAERRQAQLAAEQLQARSESALNVANAPRQSASELAEKIENDLENGCYDVDYYDVEPELDDKAIQASTEYEDLDEEKTAEQDEEGVEPRANEPYANEPVEGVLLPSDRYAGQYAEDNDEPLYLTFPDEEQESVEQESVEQESVEQEFEQDARYDDEQVEQVDGSEEGAYVSETDETYAEEYSAEDVDETIGGTTNAFLIVDSGAFAQIESNAQVGARSDASTNETDALDATFDDALNGDAQDSLAVDDVKEFSEQSTQARDELEEDAAFEDGALDGDVDDDGESESALAAFGFEAIEDECYYALDPYSSLLIAYEPTAAWTERVLELVHEILGSIEESGAETTSALNELRMLLQNVDALKQETIADARALRDVPQDELPPIVARYTLDQRLELLDGFQSALKRRAFLWESALEYFRAKNAAALVEPRELTPTQLTRLRQATSSAREFFGDSPNGKSWRASFDVDALADDLRRVLELSSHAFEPYQTTAQAQFDDDASNVVDGAGSDERLTSAELAALGKPLSGKLPIAQERARRMRFLRDRLNSIAYKIEKTPMTFEQRQVFKRRALADWSDAVVACACDQTDGLALLYAFERYEHIGGGQSGRAFQQLALRMTTSRSESCRQFGRAVDLVYDNPNVKAYLSEALINRLLPIRDPEFGVVQERILNNPVVGSRRVDTTVSINLLPDPSRLLMNLNVHGRVVAATSSEVFSAKLRNQSYATYVGQKTLEWQDAGIAYSPTVVSADSVNRLDAVETEIDFVPLVGDVAREITRSQYEARQTEIRAQMRARVAREARERIDREANERFDAVNKRLRENFFANLSNLGLSLRAQRSKTTDDWLLASLRLGSDYSLGCQTTEPPTLPGAFADVKAHESSINAFLAQLDLAGRESDPRRTLDYLAARLNRPALRDVKIEDSELSYTFAKVDPIVVRFFEDQIQLRLAFEELTLGKNSWNDLEVVVSYRPTVDAEGLTTFARDGIVELYGPTDIRSQLPLRAVFSKVFPAQKSFDLRPEVLRSDERFAGLALGLCRVSRGWFALSVVRADSTNAEVAANR